MNKPRTHAQRLVGLTLVSGDMASGRFVPKPSRRSLIAFTRHYLRFCLVVIVALVLGAVFSTPQIAVAQSTFTNPAPIVKSFSTDLISPASPYPSDIAVSGLQRTVSKVTVTLTDLN